MSFVRCPASKRPVSRAWCRSTITMSGEPEIRTDLNDQPVHVRFHNNEVAPDYFQTMGIPILDGREFLPSDRKGSPEVAIINENVSRRLFGDRNPVGHTFRYTAPTRALR